MPDIYDDAVDFFIETPEEAYAAWNAPHEHPFGHLFAYATDTGYLPGNAHCGCPSQIVHCGRSVQGNPELATQIRQKNRDLVNPLYSERVLEDQLPKFAEVQRMFDAVLPGRCEALAARHERLLTGTKLDGFGKEVV